MANVDYMKRLDINFKIPKEEYIRRCKILGIDKLDFLSSSFVPVDVENYEPPFKGGYIKYTYGMDYAISADEKYCRRQCDNPLCSGPCWVCAKSVRVMVHGPDMDTFNSIYK